MELGAVDQQEEEARKETFIRIFNALSRMIKPKPEKSEALPQRMNDRSAVWLTPRSRQLDQ